MNYVPSANAFSFYSRIAPKCIKIVRPTLFGYLETREEFEHYGNLLFELLMAKRLTPWIHKIYPLSEVPQAHTVSWLFYEYLPQ